MRIATWGLVVAWMNRYGTAGGLALLVAARAWASVAVHSALSAGQVIVPLRVTAEQAKSVQLAAGWTAWQVAVFGSATALGLSLIASGSVGADWIIVMLVCVAQGFRNAGDVGGGLLQRWNKLWLDNLLQIGGEVMWVLLAGVLVINLQSGIPLSPLDMALPMVVAAGLSMAGRWQLSGVSAALMAGKQVTAEVRRGAAELATDIRRRGVPVTVGNMSALLFAPLTTLLIGWLLEKGQGDRALAAYAPLLLIDGGLGLVAAGIGQALFPRLAAAVRGNEAGGDEARYRRLRLSGVIGVTLAVGVLAAGVWLASPFLLPIWLKVVDPATLSALPIVLIHSTVGAGVAVTNTCLIAQNRGRLAAVIGLTSGMISGIGVAIALKMGAGVGSDMPVDLLRSVAWVSLLAVAVRAVASFVASAPRPQSVLTTVQ